MLGRYQVTDQAGAQSGQDHQGSPVPLPKEATHSRSGWAAKAGGDQQTVKESHWLAREGRGAGPRLSAPRPAPCHSTEDRVGGLGRRALPCRCALWEAGMATPRRRRGLPQGGVAGALGRRWGDQSLEDTHP